MIQAAKVLEKEGAGGSTVFVFVRTDGGPIRQVPLPCLERNGLPKNRGLGVGFRGEREGCRN